MLDQALSRLASTHPKAVGGHNNQPPLASPPHSIVGRGVWCSLTPSRSLDFNLSSDYHNCSKCFFFGLAPSAATLKELLATTQP
jgi:hypothetical protein